MSSGIWQNPTKTPLQLVCLWIDIFRIGTWINNIINIMTFNVSKNSLDWLTDCHWFFSNEVDVFNLGQLSYSSQWKGAGLWDKLPFWGTRLDSPAWQSWLELDLLALGEMWIRLRTCDTERAKQGITKKLLASMRSLQHFTNQSRKLYQIGQGVPIFSSPQSVGS